jgi:hypothetical protein
MMKRLGQWCDEKYECRDSDKNSEKARRRMVQVKNWIGEKILLAVHLLLLFENSLAQNLRKMSWGF